MRHGVAPDIVKILYYIGIRLFKYSMFIDRIDSSRFDLLSMIVLRDSIYHCSDCVRTQSGWLSLLFDVEVHDKEEVIQAIAARFDAIMLEGNELKPLTWCLCGV
jgi:hypothetical protein